jgi:PAS domain S-box-containing protein
LVSARIAIGFVVWSTLWVTLSDYVLHRLFATAPNAIWQFETLKGLVYVAVTGLLLFGYIRARENEYFAARRTTENRLRRLSESNLLSICYWKSTGEITDANDAFLRMLGYSRDDLLSHQIQWSKLTSAEFQVSDKGKFQQLIAEGRHVVYEREFIRKDGTRVPVLAGAAMLDASRTRGIAYALDVSELRKAQQRSSDLEAQLRQSQKLEAVGQLASGIAHDFNNLLNIIVGYTCLIEAKVGPDESLRDEVTHVLKAAEKASSLIRKLLAFGRKQLLSPELVDINSMLREYQQIMPRLIGEKIHFELRLSPSIWPVEVDRNQLEQVIVNLAVNSRDAMPVGGKLTITTSNDESTGKVSITFTDTGIGMDEHTKARMFDPFFTTKPEGRGSGLGLSTVYGIVTQSGGQITASSEVGKGATFVIYFPKAEQLRRLPRPALETSKASVYLPDKKQGLETILLAEDEPDLRELLSNLLRMNGYRVLAAKDGESAIVIAKSHNGPIELLLTDIVMPKMNGVEAAQKIRSLRPDVRIIYMTGYAEEAFLLTKTVDEDVLLEKPIAPAILFDKIRELLDQSPRRKMA